MKIYFPSINQHNYGNGFPNVAIAGMMAASASIRSNRHSAIEG
jgi:hypothetical protein